MQMWIIGPDSYPHSPLQASFRWNPRLLCKFYIHIVGIGTSSSQSIVGIVGIVM